MATGGYLTSNYLVACPPVAKYIKRIKGTKGKWQF